MLWRLNPDKIVKINPWARIEAQHTNGEPTVPALGYITNSIHSAKSGEPLPTNNIFSAPLSAPQPPVIRQTHLINLKLIKLRQKYNIHNINKFTAYNESTNTSMLKRAYIMQTVEIHNSWTEGKQSNNDFVSQCVVSPTHSGWSRDPRQCVARIHKLEINIYDDPPIYYYDLETSSCLQLQNDGRQSVLCPHIVRPAVSQVRDQTTLSLSFHSVRKSLSLLLSPALPYWEIILCAWRVQSQRNCTLTTMQRTSYDQDANYKIVANADIIFPYLGNSAGLNAIFTHRSTLRAEYS